MDPKREDELITTTPEQHGGDFDVVQATPETDAERKEQTEGGTGAEQTESVSPTRPAAFKLRRTPPSIPQLRDQVIVKIERIMEEGLSDAYSRLSPIAQQELKLKGEQTATQIRELLQATHIKVKKVFRLILEWLKMLPGVNKFFIEQEAKIKTDKIIALKDRL